MIWMFFQSAFSFVLSAAEDATAVHQENKEVKEQKRKGQVMGRKTDNKTESVAKQRQTDREREFSV